MFVEAHLCSKLIGLCFAKSARKRKYVSFYLNSVLPVQQAVGLSVIFGRKEWLHH